MTKFIDFLMEIHGASYTGSDDDMPDNFESWLADISDDDIIDNFELFIQRYPVKVVAKQLRELLF